MIESRLGRYALGVCLAIAMFAGCGGHPGNSVVPSSVAPDRLPNHKSFYYTGGTQGFTVPAGVTHIKVVARGAQGDGPSWVYGGRVKATIPVTPGEELVVYVGGNASGINGGFNGGANGGNCCPNDYGYGGGGASDVRQGGDRLGDRILVAGGGGGFGGQYNYRGGAGGKGGAATGGNGAHSGYYGSGSYYCNGSGGDGGTQSAGGVGGAGASCYGYGGRPGASGTLGSGGSGGASSYYGNGGGGGGGGGYYGGGGGGGGGASYYYYIWGGGGGGGGGSSYVEPSATNVHMWQGGYRRDNGLIVFDW